MVLTIDLLLDSYFDLYTFLWCMKARRNVMLCNMPQNIEEKLVKYNRFMCIHANCNIYGLRT
jgi:hypothetical protein